jgi:Iap family predicted aminopeptidase
MDRMTALSLNYLSTDGRITFSAPHNLSNGDIIIVQSLTTLDDSANSQVLIQVNNPRGLVVTVINPTVISIGVDFTTIVSPDPSAKPAVLFYSKTFRFPMEIGYQDIAELN